MKFQEKTANFLNACTKHLDSKWWQPKDITGESQMLVSFQFFYNTHRLFTLLFTQIFIVIKKFNITWHCASPIGCFSTICATWRRALFSCKKNKCHAKLENESNLNSLNGFKIDLLLGCTWTSWNNNLATSHLQWTKFEIAEKHVLQKSPFWFHFK